MSVSPWFDYNAYMTNKVAQLKSSDPAGNWTMDKVAQAFAEAGYAGIEGAERHFVDFGQNEDVAPNAFFNPTEYYRAKAAHAYNKDFKAVTDADAALVKAAIKGLGMNAWSHYDTFGSSEKVNPSNQFDTNKYMEAKLAALNSIDGGKKYTIDEVYAAFKASGISALEHFMTFGGDPAKGEVAFKYDPQNPSIPAEFAVPEDKKVNAGGGGEGTTFVLTSGVDTVIGTANDDSIIAGKVNGLDTLTAGDSLDGGAGRDTLKIYGGNLAGVSAKSVEVFELNAVNVGTPSGLNNIDVSQYAGLDTVVMNSGTIGDTKTFTVTEMVDKGTVGVGGHIVGDNSAVANIAVSYVDTAATANLTLNAVNVLDADATPTGNKYFVTADFTGKGLKTINVTGEVAGSTKAVVLKQGIGTAIEHVTVTTKDKLTVLVSEGDANLDGLKTFDASGSTGDVTVYAGNLTKEASFTGGKGNDYFELSAAAVTQKFSIVGGEGTDTLALMLTKTDPDIYSSGTGTNSKTAYTISDSVYDYIKSDKLSGVEKMYLYTGLDTSGEYVKIDMSKVDLSYVATGMGGEFTGLASTDTIGLDTGFATAGENSSGKDYRLQAASSNTDKVVNVEGLNFDVNNGNYSWVSKIDTGFSDFKTLNVSGKGAVGFNNEDGAGADPLTIDASKMEAGSRFYFKGDKDIKETITFGAGKDIYATNPEGYTLNTIDVVNSFGKGDKVLFAANISNDLVKATADSDLELQAALTTAFGKASTITVITYGADLYVVESGATDSDNTEDAVVKLVGVKVGDLVANFAGNNTGTDYIEFA